MYVCEHEEEMGGSVTRTRRNLVYTYLAEICQVSRPEEVGD